MMVARGIGPLRLSPRLDPKPWGGHALAEFGLGGRSGEPIGEAVATTDDSVVADGPLRGQSLGELVAADPRGMIGDRGLAVTRGYPRFPLLVKLIDAARTLSIQVHPNDRLAAPFGQLGKTEAYYVLAAEAGASIALGLDAATSPEAFMSACRAGNGATGRVVRWLPAVPETTILIPAGTVHALGAGCLVYEIQQPSDITYRLDDWGRTDAAGNRRELHLDHGLAAIDQTSRPDVIPALTVPALAGQRDLLAACHLFALDRFTLEEGDEVEARASDSPQVVTCIRGKIAISSTRGSSVLAPGETAIIPANVIDCQPRAITTAVLLRGWVPDLRTEIVVPARAAGHPDAAITALAGALPDLQAITAHGHAVAKLPGDGHPPPAS